jgi:hypothetical protein
MRLQRRLLVAKLSVLLMLLMLLLHRRRRRRRQLHEVRVRGLHLLLQLSVLRGTSLLRLLGLGLSTLRRGLCRTS